MPNIIITERQQLIDAGKAAEWREIELLNEVWEPPFWPEDEGEWVRGNAVQFDTGGLVRFVVIAEFDLPVKLPKWMGVQDGSEDFRKGTIMLFEAELGKGGGISYQLKERKTTTDWHTVQDWVKNRDGLFTSLIKRERENA